MLDEPKQKETMRVRMKIGCYAGEIRELERSAALELLALGRVELPDEKDEAKAASAGAETGLRHFLSEKRK